MSKPTYLVIITTENTRQIEAIARAVGEISEPTDTRVIIAHVFTERTYQRALSELDEEPKSTLEKRFIEQIPAHPGIEDDVPEWVKRWSRRQIRGEQAHARDREELPQSKAIDACWIAKTRSNRRPKRSTRLGLSTKSVVILAIR